MENFKRVIIQKDIFNPYFNSAMEEYFLKTAPNLPLLIIWQNENSVILGRNQNPIEEVDLINLKEHKTLLARRMSGGGAVYHDRGNICFSIIVSETATKSFDFFYQPIIDFLLKFDIVATPTGRNDLTIDGIKISGNAQYIWKDRILHHGTLLFNMDLDKAMKILHVPEYKIKSKSINSTRSKMLNIKEKIRQDISTESFINELFSFFNYTGKDNHLSEKEINEIWAIAKSKYEDPKWIQSDFKDFNFKNELASREGRVLFSADVTQNKIRSVKFSGDFLSKVDNEEIEKLFSEKDVNLENFNTISKSPLFKNFLSGFSSSEVEQLIKPLFITTTD